MIKGVIFDLDGTVYRGQEEVPGAAAFVRFLAGHAIRSLFVTNRANRPPDVVADHLRTYGIACTADDVLTSAQATALALKPGSAYVIGESGLIDELQRAGMTFTDEKPDYVIASFDRQFTYEKMKQAARCIRSGSKFIATNPDKALQTDNGLCPGTGAIVAGIVASTGVEPLYIGKPQTLIMDMAVKRLALPKADIINVGDNVDTDVLAGINAGIRTAFILTGVSRRADLARLPSPPTWVVDSYDQLSAIVKTENEITGE